jgi:23S rRNA pseudouridine955/2504/2580 synthase
MLKYTVSANDHCRRLESFLQQLLPLALPSYLRKLIKSGACRLNSAESTPDTLLRCHDVISLKESSAVLEHLNKPQPAIDLLWQDDRLLVLNKPAGLAMHPAAEVDDNLADRASAWMEKRSNHPVRAYPINRLDRGTSGVVLLATSSSNAGMMGRQVKEEGLDKRYLTVVEGILTGEGVIDRALDGKESVSRYRSISVGEHYSFLLVEPVTGRTHQIRRHLSMIGHPVAGDKRYDGAVLENLPGIALHSFRTILQHPVDERTIPICAPLPEAVREFIVAQCGIKEETLLETLSLLA